MSSRNQGQWYSYNYYYHTAEAGEELAYSINYLQRDTEYNVTVAMDVRYPDCGYNYRFGNSSDVVSFRTNATRKYFHQHE